MKSHWNKCEGGKFIVCDWLIQCQEILYKVLQTNDVNAVRLRVLPSPFPVSRKLIHTDANLLSLLRTVSEDEDACIFVKNNMH